MVSGHDGRDIYRDTPVRYLGYANEIGEALRSFIGPRLVALSYGISTLYVVADTVDKSSRTYENTNSVTKTLFTAGDVFTWQMLASVIIPGFTINSICRGTDYILSNSRPKMVPSTRYTLVTATGLLAIPFIIKPIDHLVDVILDNTLRKLRP